MEQCFSVPMQELFPSGPWASWLNGRVIDHPAEIWHNAEGTWITAVYEEKNKTLQGVLLEAFGAFKAEGNVDALLASLDFAALEFSVHTRESKTIHFILVRSHQSYSVYAEEGIKTEAKHVLENMREKSDLLIQAAIAHDVRISPWSALSDEEQALFSTQLALAPFLSNASLVGSAAPVPVHHESLLFGVDFENKKALEDLSAFKITLVEGSNPLERASVVQVLIENLLLAKKPVLLIDFENKFRGLSTPAIEPVRLPNEPAIEPTGFPVSTITLFRDLAIDLTHSNSALIAMQFKLNLADQAGQALGRVIDSHTAADWNQVRQTLSDMPSNEAFKDYPKSRALRIARLFAQKFPFQFGEKNLAPAWKNPWMSVLGRTTRLVLAEKDPVLMRLFLDGLLGQLAEETPSEQPFVVLTGFDSLVPASDQEFSLAIFDRLDLLSVKGYGLVIETKSVDAWSNGFSQKASAVLNALAQADTSIQVKNRKNYRVKLRGTLSQPPAL